MTKKKQPDWVGKLRRQLKRAGEKFHSLSKLNGWEEVVDYFLDSPLWSRPSIAFFAMGI